MSQKWLIHHTPYNLQINLVKKGEKNVAEVIAQVNTQHSQMRTSKVTRDLAEAWTWNHYAVVVESMLLFHVLLIINI